MIRRPPRSTLDRSSAASDVYKRQIVVYNTNPVAVAPESEKVIAGFAREDLFTVVLEHLSLIHISEPTRPY